jgi:hypothetical protein
MIRYGRELRTFRPQRSKVTAVADIQNRDACLPSPREVRIIEKREEGREGGRGDREILRETVRGKADAYIST